MNLEPGRRQAPMGESEASGRAREGGTVSTWSRIRPLRLERRCCSLRLQRGRLLGSSPSLSAFRLLPKKCPPADVALWCWWSSSFQVVSTRPGRMRW